MSDIVERLRQIAGYNGDDTPEAKEAADEITCLRAEVEKLKAEIKRAIRQHEEGNKGLAHRTLCEAVYGEQA